MNVTGDRTVEHGLATIGYDDEGVAAQTWDIVRDGDPGRLPAGPADGRAHAGCRGPTAARTPTRRATSRSSGWPTCRCSPTPADPSTEDLIAGVDDGLYVVGDKSWSIDMQRYNFQFTGQRFYRIEYGAARRPGARRRLPGHHDRLLGLDGGRRRPADLRARRRVQLRQGPARPGRRRSATAARRRSSAASASSTPVRRPADERAHAAGARRAGAWRSRGLDDCVVLVERAADANLRWAGNTLTTNGVTPQRRRHGHLVRWTPSAGSARRRRDAAASRRRRAACAARRRGGGAERRCPPRTPRPLVDGGAVAGLRASRGRDHPAAVFACVRAAALGEAFARPRPRRPELYGFAEHERRHDLPGLSTGLRLPPRPADRHGRDHRQGRPARRRSAWVGPAHPRLRRRRRRRPRRRAAARRLAWEDRRSSCPPAATTRSCRRRAVADLMIYLYWSAGGPRRLRGPHGLQPRRAAARGSASSSRRAAARCSATPPYPAWSARRSSWRPQPRAPSPVGLRQRPAPRARRAGSTRRPCSTLADPDAALARGLTGLPVTPLRRQPGARGRPAAPAAWTTWSPAPSAACC